MNRLTWTDRDGAIFVDGTDCYELELEGCATVCSGEAPTKLSKYEDMQETVEKRIAEIKGSANYPHNFKGQIVEDLEWVLSLIN